MPGVSISTRIKASPEAVFALFTDLERAPQRIPAIKHLEIIRPGMQPAGPVGKGTRWRETRVMFGKEATEEMEITAFDPPRGYTAEAQSCGNHYTTRFEFRPAGGETEVQVSFEGRPLTFMAKVMCTVMAPMLKGMIRKCLLADIEALRAVAEEGVQAGSRTREAQPA